MESREFYFEFCRLLNSVNNKYDNYARNCGIVSNNLLWILYSLIDGKGHTQQDIAISCCLPKTTVNTIIKDLEKDNYVILITGQDKRKKLITLSDKGLEYANGILNDLFSKEDYIFYHNENDFEVFIEKFKKFDQLLDILNDK